ncbi:MAG: flagellar basal body rod protein FlgB [Coprococcus sp.]|nr:flagellar basal body rod protein FlgB [Coprococcus sp.]
MSWNKIAIFGNTVPLAEKALDFLWKSQETTLNNLANVDTPGFKKTEVSFEETFRKRLVAADGVKSSNAMLDAIEGSNYELHSRDDSARVDENNVNADVEQSKLARDGLQYQYLLNSITSDIKRYQTVLKTQ